MKRFCIRAIYAIYAISAIAVIFLLSCQLQVAPVRDIEDTNTQGGSPVTRSIYAAGTVYLGNDTYKPVLWVNGTPQLLPLPEEKTGGETFAIHVSSNKIYVAGQVTDTESVKYPCMWVIPIGSSPESPILLPVLSNHVGGEPSLTGIFSENGKVYALGVSVDISDPQKPQRKLCYWVNNTLTILDPPESSTFASVGLGGLWVQDGTIYIAGTVDSGENYLPYLWINGNPHSLTLPGGIDEGRVHGTFYSGGLLYVAGFYRDVSTIIPCYWKYDTNTDTSTLIPLTEYDTDTYNIAIAPFIDGTNVYMGGGLGIPNQDGWTPTYWKNGTPVPVPLPSGQTGGLVTGLTVRDGTVYLAGFYGDPEGIGSEAFIWKGATKVTGSSPESSQGTLIYAIAVE